MRRQTMNKIMSKNIFWSKYYTILLFNKYLSKKHNNTEDTFKFYKNSIENVFKHSIYNLYYTLRKVLL